MKTWNKDAVTELVIEAGRIALTHFSDPVRELKKDNSVVTQADKEIEAMIARRLENTADGVYIIGEETVETHDESYIASALENTAWIVDPIDGTSSYANGFPSWGVSVAYAQNGRITEGALYLPVGGELLISDGGAVYYGKVRLDCDEPRTELRPFAPRTRAPDRSGIIAVAQSFAKHGGFTAPNTVHATGCCVFSLVHLLLGNYISYVANLRIWDLGAGISLMEKLGFLARFEDGRPFTTAINADNYKLHPEAGPLRWKARGRIIFSSGEEGLDYTAKAFS